MGALGGVGDPFEIALCMGSHCQAFSAMGSIISIVAALAWPNTGIIVAPAGDVALIIWHPMPGGTDLLNVYILPPYPIFWEPAPAAAAAQAATADAASNE